MEAWEDIPALAQLYSPTSPPPAMLQQFAQARRRILDNGKLKKEQEWERVWALAGKSRVDEARAAFEPLDAEITALSQKAVKEVEGNIELFLLHNVRDPQVLSSTPPSQYGYVWVGPRQAHNDPRLIEQTLYNHGELEGLHMLTVREAQPGSYIILRNLTKALDALCSINMQRKVAIYRAANEGRYFSVHFSALRALPPCG